VSAADETGTTAGAGPAGAGPADAASGTPQPLDEFRTTVRAWLAQRVEEKPPPQEHRFGVGSDSVAVFHNMSQDEMRALVDDGRSWMKEKSTAGYHAVSWSTRHGGLGLPLAYDRAFREEESRFRTPPIHEAIGITRELIAPTIRAHGTDEQQDRFLPPMLRTDEMWCQLYSEPGSGSDLAGLATRAARDGDEWVIDGQKVWTSGAQFAAWGYILCRTDPDVPKHRGITAFLVPMDAPGVTVRPLRQMSGGASFNEVFFDSVRIADSLRLDAPGAGWRVAMTTLGFERSAGSGETGGVVPGKVTRLAELARHLDRADEPVVRQELARLWAHYRVHGLNIQRVRAKLRAGQTPGPEGSIGKLFNDLGNQQMTRVASLLLGPKLVADSGEWGTFAWSEHVCGAPGSRVAGGTDEIQRNIIGERGLGLPGEPRVDRDLPWSQIPRS
jgi:alkylation response protein AidB-like acyl-CoA dehydrogenase